MRKPDFSLAMYAELCKALQSHKVMTVQGYLSDKPEPLCIVLRHDVDRRVKNALSMAKLEKKCGIRSTYYFRYPRTFNRNIMQQIADMGHEVGYHYEVLDKAKGDCKKAIRLFQKELGVFREFFSVKTACMHGNPLTKWDGREIWQSNDFQTFDLLGEAFLSFHEFPVYLTDTGRNWNGENNFKDRLQAENYTYFKNTTDVITYLNSNHERSIYINCHPERWGANFAEWAIAFLRDHFFNLGKKAIKWLRF